MIQVRPSSERGHASHGWLESWHTFSFADYHDPLHMSFRCLRVINEDIIQPGQGFDTHSHHDMEILTYLLKGRLEHKDSMGNGRIIQPGELQTMSAGTGVHHSEFNPSSTEPAHLLQIWITPLGRGVSPSYAEWKSPHPISPLQLMASPDGHDGSVRIHQDARLFVGNLKTNDTLSHPLVHGRAAWIQLMHGHMKVQDHLMSIGDGAAIADESSVSFKALDHSRFLLFDLP